ncbi:pentatricopeptide repeat-containing protein At1g64583, mitochondrial-like [Magnolia sinica]|uniref:pentatricopeptide repeat-containing protein At1g64583, mitochondrial-like n=1 Tax=Magnolia sinica TaxID=86752 RepID=UPI00265A53CF|nr:pentatricopeptide repeat-containing protein At1g64583, mitochondrial-like [Magnolia sinica]
MVWVFILHLISESTWRSRILQRPSCSTKCQAEPASLETYINCLCEEGKIEEASYMFSELKKVQSLLNLMVWNVVLLASLLAGQTNLVWELYRRMMESGVAGDLETVGCPIWGFCKEK